MSKSKKHVEWCLRKAEKELREKNDHKGLVKIKQDVNHKPFLSKYAKRLTSPMQQNHQQ